MPLSLDASGILLFSVIAFLMLLDTFYQKLTIVSILNPDFYFHGHPMADFLRYSAVMVWDFSTISNGVPVKTI